MAELLVSVRSIEEASAALEGGAAIIDVKEPANGSLGRADDRIIEEIVRLVQNRAPVSAALGEWVDDHASVPDADLAYVKWGLARCGRAAAWHAFFTQKLASNRIRPQHVMVAYADWECAQAPSIEEVLEVALGQPGSVLLIDTHCKEANGAGMKTRPTLLDWLPRRNVLDICARCRAAQVKIALAGSLGTPEINELLPAEPDWFAVRGAVCEGSDRRADVRADKVRHLVQMLARRASFEVAHS